MSFSHRLILMGFLGVAPSLASLSDANADEAVGRLSIAGDVGGSLMSSSFQRGTLGYGFGMGGMLHPQVALSQSLYARLALGRSYFPADDGYGAASIFGVGVRKDFSALKKWNPFVDFDIGLSRTGDRSRFGVVVGLGVQKALGNGVALGPILRYSQIITRQGDENADAKFITLGLSITFASTGPSTQVISQNGLVESPPQDAPETRALASIRGGGIETLRAIHFDFAKATLTNDSIPTIRAVAGVLFAHPNIEHMSIEGHADAIGSAAFNRALSHERALTIKNLLVEFGVETTRLEVLERGEEKPVAPNQTESGRAANRRVEFIIETRSTPNESPRP